MSTNALPVLNIPRATQSSLLSGLVASYNFYDAINLGYDATGQHPATNKGTVSATGGISSTVLSGGAFTSNSSSWLQITSGAPAAAFSFGTGSFTIALAVNLATATADQVFAACGLGSVTGPPASLAWELLRQQASSHYKLQIFGDAAQTDLPAAVTATNTASGTGKWDFLVAWRDAATNTCYIRLNNGAAVTGSATTGCFVTNGHFSIGALTNNGGGGASRTQGRIAILDIWNRVLTTAEQTTWYNGAAGLPYPFRT